MKRSLLSIAACFLLTAYGAPSNATSLVSITISPKNINITPYKVTNPSTGEYKKNSQQFTAIGKYEDGSTRDITSSVVWISSLPYVASISPLSGLAKVFSGNSGTTKIVAMLGAIHSNAATLTIAAHEVPPPENYHGDDSLPPPPPPDEYVS